jgi:hypothetical protein
MRTWNELSMAEKADVMKLAIEGGVYDLDSIRSGYNEIPTPRLTEIKVEVKWAWGMKVTASQKF